MTRRALALAALLALLTGGCADGPSGSRYLRHEQGRYGRTDYYSTPSGIMRYWSPAPGIHARPRWLEPWEVPPG